MFLQGPCSRRGRKVRRDPVTAPVEHFVPGIYKLGAAQGAAAASLSLGYCPASGGMTVGKASDNGTGGHRTPLQWIRELN